MFKQTAICNGQEIHTHKLFKFDRITTARFRGMPKNDEYRDWATTVEPVLELDESPIIVKQEMISTGYFVINGFDHFVGRQCLLIRRLGYWQWMPVEKILVDDFIFIKNKITRIDSIEGVLSTCTLVYLITEKSPISMLNNTPVFTGVRNVFD